LKHFTAKTNASGETIYWCTVTVIILLTVSFLFEWRRDAVETSVATQKSSLSDQLCLLEEAERLNGALGLIRADEAERESRINARRGKQLAALDAVTPEVESGGVDPGALWYQRTSRRLIKKSITWRDFVEATLSTLTIRPMMTLILTSQPGSP